LGAMRREIENALTRPAIIMPRPKSVRADGSEPGGLNGPQANRQYPVLDGCRPLAGPGPEPEHGRPEE
jgi:hypothetical protein